MHGIEIFFEYKSTSKYETPNFTAFVIALPGKFFRPKNEVAFSWKEKVPWETKESSGDSQFS